MLSLEMLGYYDDTPGSQQAPMGLDGLLPDTGDFLAFVSDLDSADLLGEVADAFLASDTLSAERLAAPPALPEAGFSDHWSFWQVGYPAVMVTDTAFLRNPHYHEPTDSPATLDHDRFVLAYEGLVSVVETLAR